MIKSISLARAIALSGTFCATSFCQDAPAAKVPLDHYLGTITAVDAVAHTVTLQEDKTGTVHVIRVADTKTILKVEPTAKDLKNATRITADNLETGDRIDVRGSKSDTDLATLNARSVILMSARALEEHHQQQAAAWTHSTNGLVTAVDAAAATVTMNARAAGATQSVSIKTTPGTEFTRYSPDGGKSVPSQLAQIEVGDQLRVVGDKNEDGSVINAQRVYSGAFRTISATISALGADGKSLTVKDLASKKEMSVSLAPDSAIHKLPPMMAGMLARRLNPSAAPASGAAGAPGNAPNGSMRPEGPPAAGPGPGGSSPGGTGQAGPPAGMPDAGGRPAGGRGDISQMIEHLPKIELGELKAGDALVISGVATGPANSQLLATTVIAGVEPILQAAPQQRGGRSVGGDWGLGEMSAPQ